MPIYGWHTNDGSPESEPSNGAPQPPGDLPPPIDHDRDREIFDRWEEVVERAREQNQFLIEFREHLADLRRRVMSGARPPHGLSPFEDDVFTDPKKRGIR